MSSQSSTELIGNSIDQDSSTQEPVPLIKLTSRVTDEAPQLPLEHRYAVWICPRRKGGRVQCALSYAEQIRMICRFETIEQFWAMYVHMKNTEHLSELSDLFVFKDGIRPMWEDEANRDGGRLAVHMAKRNSGRLWELLLLALVGEQLTLCCTQICGVAFSPKPHDDIISVWCRGGKGNDAEQEAMRNKIKSSFMRILNIPSTLSIEYRPHMTALSSCRGKPGQSKAPNGIYTQQQQQSRETGDELSDCQAIITGNTSEESESK
ncbi:hypothetical protein ACOME3_008411 [Neoechinorhynchus agilis]